MFWRRTHPDSNTSAAKYARNNTDRTGSNISGVHYVSPEVVFGQWNTSCVNICMPQAFEFLQCIICYVFLFCVTVMSVLPFVAKCIHIFINISVNDDAVSVDWFTVSKSNDKYENG